MASPQEVVCHLKIVAIFQADIKSQTNEDRAENDQSDDWYLKIIGPVIKRQPFRSDCDHDEKLVVEESK